MLNFLTYIHKYIWYVRLVSIMQSADRSLPATSQVVMLSLQFRIAIASR